MCVYIYTLVCILAWAFADPVVVKWLTRSLSDHKVESRSDGLPPLIRPNRGETDAKQLVLL